MAASIYPHPQWLIERNESVNLSSPVFVAVQSAALQDAGQFLSQSLEGRLVLEITQETENAQILITDLEDEAFRQAAGKTVPAETYKSGGYALTVDAGRVIIAGADLTGALYGAQSLLQLIQSDGTIPGLLVFDWPYKPLRGIHIYMPGRDRIPFFKRLLSVLASLKYNTVFLEVGGGMRYDKHPEVNAAWEKFCAEAEAYPGGPYAVEAHSKPYEKDSTHTELGGGSFLEKSEVADLLAYARRLHIEIIPEVQSLSHCYYLCCAHPEIAERADDPWPDTYCPSNPASYELLFDIMQEVIDVFHPRVMHIGHDEVYHLGICPRCKDKSGHELLHSDLMKIHTYLAERGIRMAMWGDKLWPSFSGSQGGMEINLPRRHTPATYKAIDGLPRDIMISEWLGNTDPSAARFFLKEGFEVVAGNFGGNFKAHTFIRWNERATSPQFIGGEVSTWCDVTEWALGYNGCIFNMLFSAQMLWWNWYRDLDREAINAELSGRFPQVRKALSGDSGKPTIDPASYTPLYFEKTEQFLEKPAVRANLSGQKITIGCALNALRFTHTCETEYQRRPSWQPPDVYHFPPEDQVAAYTVLYADGTSVQIPIYYASHVSRWDIPYGEHIDSIPYWADPLPAGSDPTGRRVTLYQYEWVNPKPEVHIESIQLQALSAFPGILWLLELEGVQVS